MLESKKPMNSAEAPSGAAPNPNAPMHSWIYRHIFQLEAIYARRALRRPKQPFAPLGQEMLPIHVLVPLPRILAPRKAG